MEKPDVQALATRMIAAVKANIADALRPLAARLDEFDARLKALPPPEKGDKGDSVKGDPGEVDPEMVRDEVARAMAEIPRPKDGIDAAPVDVEALVARVVALVPTPEPAKDGQSVDPLAVRAWVADEVRQAVAALPAAVDGTDGEDGRDAAELDILPSIDEAKSYRRGTWASHAGGLIRAARATDPVEGGALLEAGWVVMVEGLACPPIVTQGEDPRELSVACMLTSGVKAASTFRVPMVIDRGVWREGEHEAGDHVSWDGSGWIAQRATADKPGTSDAWRLSTKRGRDGKDATPAAKAPEPVRLR